MLIQCSAKLDEILNHASEDRREERAKLNEGNKELYRAVKDIMTALEKVEDDVQTHGSSTGQRSSSCTNINVDDSEDGDNATMTLHPSRLSRYVTFEEFTLLSQRVDTMDSKLDTLLAKFEALEKAQLKHRETMGKIVNIIAEVGTEY